VTVDFTRYVATSSEGFTGRGWLFEEISGWLQSQDARRYFLILGEPGSGKTAVAACVARAAAADTLLPESAAPIAAAVDAVHFCTLFDRHWINPSTFAESLAAQLAERFPAYARALVEQNNAQTLINVDQEIGSVSGGHVAGVLIQQLVVQGIPPADVFARMVRSPLEALYAGNFDEPILILVDGLDEALAYGGEETILTFLANADFLPRQVRFLVTANPDVEVLRALRRSDPAERDLSSGAGLEASLDDIADYIRTVLDKRVALGEKVRESIGLDTFVDMVRKCSEGNFLYVRSLLEMAAAPDQPIDPANLYALPRDLNQVYLRRAQALAGNNGEWEAEAAPLLGTLAVAQQGLTEAQLAALTGISRSTVRRILKQYRPWLDADESVPTSERAYALFHRSLADFLLDPDAAEEFWLEAMEQHQRVVDAAWAAFPDPTAVGLDHLLAGYALRHLVYHVRRAGTGYRAQLEELLAPSMRRAKRRIFGSDAVFSQDLGEAITAALEHEPRQSLPWLVRYGLIDASLLSITAVVPPALLYNLARLGQWERAQSLAALSAEGAAGGVLATVRGMLAAETPDVERAQRLAQNLPGRGADARERALALAVVAAHLAIEDAAAAALFADAQAAAAAVPALDERGRTLATIAQLCAPFDRESARQNLDAALETVRAMDVDFDPVTFEDVSAYTMISQSVDESSWMVRQTEVDTLGAKARALADVAAALAGVGDLRAEEVFVEAEEIVAIIPTLPTGQIVGVVLGADESLDQTSERPRRSGIYDLFAEHATDYIAARRQGTAPDTVEIMGSDQVEAALEGTQRIPPDERGFQARAFLALARALVETANASDLAPAALALVKSLLQRTASAAAEAAGGYGAEVLADAAALWARLGERDRAESLAERAAAIAGDDADLLASYRAWLAKVGTEWAASLRVVAATRAGFQKRRTYSDKALVQVAQGLAAQDLDGARVLVDAIQDKAQRVRALAALAGHAARQGNAQADPLLQETLQGARNLAADERDYVLYGAVSVLAPLDAPQAQQMVDEIHAADFKMAAQVALAEHQEGEKGERLWQAAWQVAQSLRQPTLASVLALAQLAVHWTRKDDARAGQVLARANEDAGELPSTLEQIEALTQLAGRVAAVRGDPARAFLHEARALVPRLSDRRGRGRSLSRLAGTMMQLDPAQACHWLAELRTLGRENFLDGVAQIAPGAAQLGGAEMILHMVEALDKAEAFFVSA
jgi:transcriptional regulator with XRE-family HTH domain